MTIVTTTETGTTSTEISALTAYLSDPSRCPVCAVPVVIAATLLPVDFTLHLVTDTLARRAACIAALQQFFLQDGQIGGAIAVSRADAAISAGDGEWEHIRTAPAADVVCAATALPVLGTVSFT